jgi:CheY-like chemotaxis protein
MTLAMAIDQVQRRVNDFQQRCGEYGEAALHLAYHAALPVALNAELLHLLRINFFLDPPEVLPYTVEFEFLLSPLCREIDEGLYEIEPEIRDVLLAGLTQTYGIDRTRDIANFLNPEKAQQWLETVETEISQGQGAAREWFVAIRQEIENQGQLPQEEEEGALELFPPLSFLSWEQQLQFKQRAKIQRFLLGQIVWATNTPGTLLLIVDGQVRLISDQKTSVLLEPGDWLGDLLDLSGSWQARAANREVTVAQWNAELWRGVMSSELDRFWASQRIRLQTQNVKATKVVLWVDDNPDNNIGERRAMEVLGISFILATSTEEALQKLNRQHFDAIISDMGRPPDPQAGYTLLDRLRSNGDETPFVIYAGSSNPTHVAESRRRGAVGCTNNLDELSRMVLLAISKGSEVEKNPSLSKNGNDGKVILKSLVNEVKKLVNADRGTLWIIDSNRDQLCTKIQTVDDSLQELELRIPARAGFAGQVVTTGKPLLVPFDLYNHSNSQTEKEIDLQVGYRTCSMLCMPLFSRNSSLIGVIQLVNKINPGEYPPFDPASYPEAPECWKASFNRTDQGLIKSLNIQIGEMLENSELLEHIINSINF